MLTIDSLNADSIQLSSGLNSEHVFSVPYRSWDHFIKTWLSFNSLSDVIKTRISSIEQNGASKRGIELHLLRGASRVIQFIYPITPELEMVVLNYYRWHFTQRKAVKLGLQIIEKYKPDVIYSTDSHIVPSKLSKMTGVPWVAEFQDLWSLNPLSPKIYPLRLWQRRLERKTIKSSTAIVAVSRTMARTLEQFHRRPVNVLPMGFDEPDYDVSIPLTKKFTLTFVGHVHKLNRLKPPFFDALGQLRDEGIISPSDFELRFINEDRRAEITVLAKQYKVDSLLVFYDWMPFNECVIKQMESTALFCLSDWDDEKEPYCFPYKIYGYMGSRRPVLGMFSNDNDVSLILRETGCGVVANTLSDIKKVLHQWVIEFKNEGRIKSYYSPKEDAVSNYTHSKIMGKLARIFAEITENGQRNAR